MESTLNTFAAIQGALDERLHDCPFDLEQARFDELGHEWLGRFLRPVHEGPAVQRCGSFLLGEVRLPVVEALVRFRGVRGVRVLDDPRIRRFSFNRVREIGGGLRLEFNEQLRIELMLTEAWVATYDEAPLPGIEAVYRSVLLVELGPWISVAPGTQSNWAV